MKHAIHIFVILVFSEKSSRIYKFPSYCLQKKRLRLLHKIMCFFQDKTGNASSSERDILVFPSS